MRLIFFLSILFFSMFALGSGEKSVKKNIAPTKLSPSPWVRVVYGDKVTTFSIVKNKNGHFVDFTNSYGQIASAKLAEKDYKFITGKIEKLEGETNDKLFCSRSYIEIQGFNKNLVGCIGARNPLAKNMLKVVNILSSLF